MSRLPETGVRRRKVIDLRPDASPAGNSIDALVVEDLLRRVDVLERHAPARRDGALTSRIVEQLEDDLGRVRNDLVLLDCNGGTLVVEELLALLAAYGTREPDGLHGGSADAGAPVEASRFIALLHDAANALARHAGELRQGSRGSAVFSLVPMLNDTRACRELPLFASELLRAVGVELPSDDHLVQSAPDAVSASDGPGQLAPCRDRRLVAALRRCLDQADSSLIGPASGPYWREIDDGLGARLTAAEHRQQALQMILFASARVLSDALSEGRTTASPARRQVLLSLARWLDAARPTAPPETLCLDLLYEVAQLDADDVRVARLQARFALHRVVPALPPTRVVRRGARSNRAVSAVVKTRPVAWSAQSRQRIETARRLLREVDLDARGLQLVGAPLVGNRLRPIDAALSDVDCLAVAPALRAVRALGRRLEGLPLPGERIWMNRLIATLDLFLGCIQQSGEGSERLVRETGNSLERLVSELDKS